MIFCNFFFKMNNFQKILWQCGFRYILINRFLARCVHQRVGISWVGYYLRDSAKITARDSEPASELVRSDSYRLNRPGTNVSVLHSSVSEDRRVNCSDQLAGTVSLGA